MADSREALRKLQSGQTLTNAERQVLGLAPAVATPAATPTPASVASFRKAEEADAAAGTPFGQAGSTTVTPTTVTSTRSGITAQSGTRLGDTLTAQNAARAARDAAFAKSLPMTQDQAIVGFGKSAIKLGQKYILVTAVALVRQAVRALLAVLVAEHLHGLTQILGRQRHLTLQQN
jgi:hypothetical protein